MTTDDLIARAERALEGVTDVEKFQRRYLMLAYENMADGLFISSARTLVPELVEALRNRIDNDERLSSRLARMTAERDALKKQLERAESEREREAGEWLEQHAHQHAVNTKLAAERDHLAAENAELKAKLEDAEARATWAELHR